jgi:hypothetical protein
MVDIPEVVPGVGLEPTWLTEPATFKAAVYAFPPPGRRASLGERGCAHLSGGSDKRPREGTIPRRRRKAILGQQPVDASEGCVGFVHAEKARD